MAVGLHPRYRSRYRHGSSSGMANLKVAMTDYKTAYIELKIETTTNTKSFLYGCSDLAKSAVIMTGRLTVSVSITVIEVVIGTQGLRSVIIRGRQLMLGDILASNIRTTM
ncbi:hypothetical protein BGZ95_003447 [Linnemannia exigua]|uniref:Uncharacterized protein n=1 Tax=Linnemannia exigua TaxID=604196 RepID=A0AAD4DHY8_9FUNG|nr:hypothetical protein BGZ95_003447 [Linnemannia exigua]